MTAESPNDCRIHAVGQLVKLIYFPWISTVSTFREYYSAATVRLSATVETTISMLSCRFVAYMKCFWATRVAGKIRGKKVGIFPPFFL